MALFLRQDENRTELQKKLVAELQDKARKAKSDGSDYDGVNDSEYVKELKDKSSFSWLFVLLIIALAAGLVWLVSTVLSR